MRLTIGIQYPYFSFSPCLCRKFQGCGAGELDLALVPLTLIGSRISAVNGSQYTALDDQLQAYGQFLYRHYGTWHIIYGISSLLLCPHCMPCY
ncbi:hypothetical protein TNCT_36651 [Trichonephila clavata]|uniref:Uncharacterized protein n=1 Tax=Trichonephila clavata TaxID=2740835 RepID=A0A8X6FV73_TRICU|nr:hypothetical protein TNCT_36651 [Trichonephila clavata]